MTSRRWLAVPATVVLAGIVVGLGLANPVSPSRISTDRLGPDSGEAVAAYLDRARTTLETDPDADREAEHWALVSLDTPITPTQLVEVAHDLRISQVLFGVPLDRVQTPLVAVPVAANPTAVLRAPTVAAARLQASAVGHDRQSRVVDYSAAQLAESCACVVAATARGSLEQLRQLSDRPGVRAVEALPADAVAGAFSVTPLLPTQTTSVLPGPDDGPVPDVG
ncbi:hypothetical protein [Rhodococcus xishaensis]|uniref:Uncharacterized protein n=1 Tax=Rhodococcus xishaensis TaxID=2487364 RepID=A0A438B3V3_9NOCA|nr:hypothetical protein [Rhodococcus xishaensis]RVW05661.1 hypothetical protein EGT50_03710 [Rhodococcus xishaensis]